MKIPFHPKVFHLPPITSQKNSYIEDDGQTELTRAILSNELEKVEKLINDRPELINHPNNLHLSPLSIAIQFENNEIIKRASSRCIDLIFKERRLIKFLPII